MAPRQLNTRRTIVSVVAVIASATLIGTILLWPRPSEIPDVSLGIAADVYRATVVSVDEAACSFAEGHNCLVVGFRLDQGPDVGSVTVQEFTRSERTPRLEMGDPVVLNHLPDASEDFRYRYADRERRGLLIGTALLFSAAVVAMGRAQGLRALFGLALSVVFLIAFIVPAIVAGKDPVLVAAVGGSLIALVTLYVTHGRGPLTHVSAVGIFGALLLTVGLSTLTYALARFSGFGSDDTAFLMLIPGIEVQGLLLAGAVLGTLGVLDDVAVTQASAVWELKDANPEMTSSELTAAGLRVGRHHIASTVNTLLLAYAGAALPLLLLFSVSGQPLSIVANSEAMAVEILRTLVGSIGLVAAVPLTTWLAAREVTTT